MFVIHIQDHKFQMYRQKVPEQLKSLQYFSIKITLLGFFFSQNIHLESFLIQFMTNLIKQINLQFSEDRFFQYFFFQ